MKIKPLHNHVVIKQQDETETMYGNIIVPDAGKEKAMIGDIVAVGPGVINMNGVLIPNGLKVGQRVTFPAFGGQRITIKGDEYLIYKEQDIFAILEEEVKDLPHKLPEELVRELVDFPEKTVTLTETEYNKLINKTDE
jgi:chaperonin GroES